MPIFLYEQAGLQHVKKLMKKGIMLFTWTSRTPDVDQKYSDGVIFENYRPNPKY